MVREVPERLLDLLQHLVRTSSPSSSPNQGLREVEVFLKAAGIETSRLPREGVSPVLVAGRPPRPELPTFLFAAHVDTVPDLGTMAQAPGTVEGRWLHGRGALDMKSGLAVALLLLQEFGHDPRFNLGLAVTTDEEEESGGAWALQDFLPRAPDLVLVPEPTWERVALSAHGRRVWNVTLEGSGGHGEGLKSKDAPMNPLVAMGRVLSGLPSGFTPLTLASEGGGQLTFPRSLTVRVDHLLPPGASPEKELARLKTQVRAKLGPAKGLKVTVAPAARTTPWLPGYETRTDNRWVQAFLKGLKLETRSAEIFHEPAVGDFNIFGSKGPTLIYGPGGEGAHADAERVDLPSLARCWAVYRRFLLNAPTPA